MLEYRKSEKKRRERGKEKEEKRIQIGYY